MMLNEILCGLQKRGCFPVVAYRGGGKWRAHINGAGNFWSEATIPQEALDDAIRLWEKKGCKMDGYAA